MKLYVLRTIYTPTSTLGYFFNGTQFFCYTLEDVVRKSGIKIPGATAIPAGKYDIVLSFSNRFQKITPQILNVPGFDGIRFHGGNTSADTEGCILVAYNKVNDTTIQGSASSAVTNLIAAKPEQSTIEIINTYPYYGVE